MRRRRRPTPLTAGLAAPAAAIALCLLAGCGSSDDADDESAAPAVATPATQPEDPATTPAPPLEPEPDPGADGDPGAGSDDDSAALERIVRAWSEALNADDNGAAADLFAVDALAIQTGRAVQLRDREIAIAWHETLPCSGTIVELEIRENVVFAVFELGHRGLSQCDAPPGTLAAAAFVIEGGKIMIWQQIPVADDGTPVQPEPGEPLPAPEPAQPGPPIA